MFIYLASALASSVVGAALDSSFQHRGHHLVDDGSEPGSYDVVDAIGCAGKSEGRLKLRFPVGVCYRMLIRTGSVQAKLKFICR